MHEHLPHLRNSVKEPGSGAVPEPDSVAQARSPLIVNLDQQPPQKRASVLRSLSRAAGNRAVSRAVRAPKARTVTAAAMATWTRLAGQVHEYAVLRERIAGYGHLFEADHLIEDRFWKVLPGGLDPANWPATLVPRNPAVAAQLKGYSGYVHSEKTRRLRKLIPHGKEQLFSLQQVWDAHAKVLGDLGVGHGLDLVHDAGDMFSGTGVELRTTFSPDHFDPSKWKPERLTPIKAPAKPRPAAGKTVAKAAGERATEAINRGGRVASGAKFAAGLVLDAALLAVDLILSALEDRLEEANNEGLRQAWKLVVQPKIGAKMAEELGNALLLVQPEPRWITVRWRSVMEVQNRDLADAAVALLRLISLQGTYVEVFDHVEVEDVFISPVERNERVTGRDGGDDHTRYYVFESSVLINDPEVSKRWLLEDGARTFARDQWRKLLKRLGDPGDDTWLLGLPLLTGDFAGAAHALGELGETLEGTLRDDVLEFRQWLEQEAQDQSAGRAALDAHQRGLLELLEEVMPQRSTSFE
jgi:hypothetical protein